MAIIVSPATVRIAGSLGKTEQLNVGNLVLDAATDRLALSSTNWLVRHAHPSTRHEVGEQHVISPHFVVAVNVAMVFLYGFDYCSAEAQR